MTRINMTIAVLALGALALAVTPATAVTPVSSLNVTAYLGRWYQVHAKRPMNVPMVTARRSHVPPGVAIC